MQTASMEEDGACACLRTNIEHSPTTTSRVLVSLRKSSVQGSSPSSSSSCALLCFVASHLSTLCECFYLVSHACGEQRCQAEWQVWWWCRDGVCCRRERQALAGWATDRGPPCTVEGWWYFAQISYVLLWVVCLFFSFSLHPPGTTLP